MRAYEFLHEAAPIIPAGGTQQEQDSPEIEQLKLALSSKIKELPSDESTQKLLQEIEDLLATVGAGSRSQFVGNALQLINDPDVNKAQKLLAKYILSLDASPADRKSLLESWKSDQLVNIKSLLSTGRHTVSEIINGYETNPAIKEITDDLSQIAALGQGKGEFLLSVFSKKITKAVKGDLHIDGFGTLEVKTTDKGSARFYDQQVRPTSKFQGAVNEFKAIFKNEIKAQGVLSASGINMDGLVKLYTALPPEKRNEFKSSLTDVMINIYPAEQELAASVVDAVMVGNIGQAKQRYVVASLNNYIAIKTDDKGVLMINLAKNPYTFTFFTDNKSLNAGGMRLHAKTVYPIADDPRYVYPQADIVDTALPQE